MRQSVIQNSLTRMDLLLRIVVATSSNPAYKGWLIAFPEAALAIHHTPCIPGVCRRRDIISPGVRGNDAPRRRPEAHARGGAGAA